MRILFENYPYAENTLQALPAAVSPTLLNGREYYGCVGYCHSASREEAIFLLPKVFIVNGKAFGRYSPETLAQSSLACERLSTKDKNFIFEVSAWIYQCIQRFNERHAASPITATTELAGIINSKGAGGATLLDRILALIRFQKEHRQLFSYIANAQRGGTRNIHWGRTIRNAIPLLRNGGKPYYTKYVAKGKTIDVDEELIVLFYSTLSYLSQSYYFPAPRETNFPMLKARQVADLIRSGKGTRKLRSIRHRYFSDGLTTLWHLLYTFYAQAEQAAHGQTKPEWLMVKNFNVVFEDMIDCLIGDDSLPSGLKAQKDGKIVDHIYRDRSLLEDGEIYFIGDSKYYREDVEIGGASLYKQFTYAKNAIQYHIDIFNERQKGTRLPYRDGLTEGYNPTPNFFIRGFIDPDDLTFGDHRLEQVGSARCNYHFANRLFDRDTLLLLTYNINFLYALCAYVQSRGANGIVGKFLRITFRKDIIKAYSEEYEFYLVAPRNGEPTEAFVHQHFRTLIGKVYSAATGQLILALKRREPENVRLVKWLSRIAYLERHTIQ